MTDWEANNNWAYLINTSKSGKIKGEQTMEQNETYTKGWTHNGTRISVTEGGMFEAVLDDTRLSDTTLDGVKAKINKIHATAAKQKATPMSLKVVGLFSRNRYSMGDWTVHHDIQRGINRTGGHPMYTDLPKDARFDEICPDTPEAVAALERYARAMAESSAARIAVGKLQFEGGVNCSVSAENYAACVETVIRKYNAKLAEIGKPQEIEA